MPGKNQVDKDNYSFAAFLAGGGCRRVGAGDLQGKKYSAREGSATIPHGAVAVWSDDVVRARAGDVGGRRHEDRWEWRDECGG